ncbi:uncharacterized protein LOC111614232 isoform X2 [Centruroides sculpturatus]|uniref:uncharacterized protein LOC111614232 isoform X2 n=1 Tax=Centruroides sculpturatus TaxID=218467 RepID=UPI000C6E96E1|nr:uncharacterized protein LOC111614232 isoform X2 [Centruroides sculpturatus]
MSHHPKMRRRILPHLSPHPRMIILLPQKKKKKSHHKKDGDGGLKTGGIIEKCLIRRRNDRIRKIDSLDVEKFGVPKSSKIKIPCPRHHNFIEHCALCDVFSYKYYMKTDMVL